MINQSFTHFVLVTNPSFRACLGYFPPHSLHPFPLFLVFPFIPINSTYVPPLSPSIIHIQHKSSHSKNRQACSQIHTNNKGAISITETRGKTGTMPTNTNAGMRWQGLPPLKDIQELLAHVVVLRILYLIRTKSRPATAPRYTGIVVQVVVLRILHLIRTKAALNESPSRAEKTGTMQPTRMQG